MSIYSTLRITRIQAMQEIMSRLLTASDEDLACALFGITRNYEDPFYFNNFTVSENVEDEE